MKKILRSRFLNSTGLLLALMLGACATEHAPEQKPAAILMPENLAADTPPVGFERADPTLHKGNDRFIKMPSARPAIELTGEAVALNFEQAPLTEVVHAILGDILELDYIVEHPISGEITLRTRTPVPRDQLLVILESLLQANNAYLLRDSGNRYVVSASANMARLRPGFVNPGSQGAGFANVIVPLQYIGAEEMAGILRPVADESSFVRIDPVRNLLVLAGRRNQLEGWLEIISTFDIDMLQGMSVGLFPLKESTPAEAEFTLRTLLETALGTESGLPHLVRIVPMERLNSLMVITPRAHYLEKVREWLERVDQAPDHNNERRLFVYSVQNTSATNLARLMSSVFGGSGQSGTSGGTNTGGVAPGLTPNQVGSGSDMGTSGTSTPGSGSNRNSAGTTSFNIGEIRVVADEENNSLLVYASRNEFRRIEAALKQLDILPSQVLIEASILEISLTEELSFGLSWYLNNNLGNGWSGRGQIRVPGSSGTGNTSASGLAYSIYDSAGDLKTVINALADKSLVNILSTPTITVLDNQSASIQVGTQQPVQSGSSITDGGVSSTSISYRDTGVMLEVTPSVNAGGMVTMIVKQSITDVGEPEPATGQRPFLKRDLSTRVAVRSGESAVLGGLIRENSGQGKVGLPLLQNVPILGHFFGRTTNTKNRTELLVVITPRVLTNEQDLRDVTREMQERMRGLKFIEGFDNSLDKSIPKNPE